MDLLLITIYGLAIGFIGGYAGIAGAPFLILLLSMGFTTEHFTQHQAQGTILAVMMGPMTLFGVIALWDKLKPYLKYAFIGTICYAVFSYIGGMIAYLFSADVLKVLFGILLIGISIRYFISNMYESKKNKSKEVAVPVNLLSFSIIGAGVGIIGGMFGIGAGVLMMPIFTALFKIDKDVARAVSLAILLPPVSVGAVLKYNSMGDIKWNVALIIFVTFFAVNYFGSKLARGHSHKTFMIVFSVILFILGVVIIIQGI